MSSRYTVREYGRAGHSSTCWLSIEERGDSWGLLVAEEGASEANEEWLPLSKISTYDVGGQYMSASKTDGNSLVVIMRPQKYGEHFVRREFGTTQAEEIVKRLATLEIQRVKETENNLEGSITAAMLTSIGVLAALESPGSKRSAAQIEKLHNFFKTDIDGEGESWFSELTDMQQSDCCRCFTAMRAKQYKMVVEQGGRADNFYVIAAGSVTILLNGHEIRHRGQGECFGEAELEKLGDKRMSSVMALEDSVFAVLSRADYRRIVGLGLEDAWPILDVPPSDRTQDQLQILLETFGDVPFIKELPYQLLQFEVCRVLHKKNFADGGTIYKSGQRATTCYIVGAGGGVTKTRVADIVGDDDAPEQLTQQILSGDSFGSETLNENKKATYKYTAVAHGMEKGEEVVCAYLTQADFHAACVVVGAAAMRVLRRPPRLRQEHNVRMLMHMFRDLSFFSSMGLESMRYNTVRFMGVETLEKGEVLYEQGKHGDKYFVVLMGKVKMLNDKRKVVSRKFPGEGFGEAVLQSNHATYAETAVGMERTVLATVFREDYHRLLRLDEVNAAIGKFFDVLVHPQYPNRWVVQFDSYQELHMRITRTLTYITDRLVFDEEGAERAAAQDWEEDLKANGIDGGASQQYLSKQRFGEALYMLVDDWSEGVGPVSLFIDFLNTLFENVTEAIPESEQIEGKHSGARRLKKLDDVQSMAEHFEDMREAGLKEGRRENRQAILERRQERDAFDHAYDGDEFASKVESAARHDRRLTFKAAVEIIDDAIKTDRLTAVKSNIDHPKVADIMATTLMVDQAIDKLVNKCLDTDTDHSTHLATEAHHLTTAVSVDKAANPFGPEGTDLSKILGMSGSQYSRKHIGIWSHLQAVNQIEVFKHVPVVAEPSAGAHSNASSGSRFGDTRMATPPAAAASSMSWLRKHTAVVRLNQSPRGLTFEYPAVFHGIAGGYSNERPPTAFGGPQPPKTLIDEKANKTPKRSPRTVGRFGTLQPANPRMPVQRGWVADGSRRAASQWKPLTPRTSRTGKYDTYQRYASYSERFTASERVRSNDLRLPPLGREATRSNLSLSKGIFPTISATGTVVSTNKISNDRIILA